jgi:cyanate permease
MLTFYSVTFLAGFNYYIAVVNLPQRFQIVDGDSPVAAGVKLLPLMISSAASSIAAGAINRRRNLHSYTVIVASALQLLGYGLMTTLGDSEPTPQRQFGFQVLLGAGFGPAISIVTQIVQLQAPPQWLGMSSHHALPVLKADMKH